MLVDGIAVPAGYSYRQNPDTTINQHGNEMLRLVKSGCIPLNLLNINGTNFDGGLTFRRGDAASQNDWFMCNELVLSSTRMVRFHRDVEMSDHIPISPEFEFDLNVSWNQIKRSITDILCETNNHSRKPVIRMNGIVKDTFCRLLNQQVLDNAIEAKDTEETLCKLKGAFYDCAKRSKVSQNSQQSERSTQLTASNDTRIATNNRNEHTVWASLMSTRDPRLIWEKIE